MSYPLTPIALPVRFERKEGWPYDPAIIDADGATIIEQTRFAWSSKAKDVYDVLCGFGFDADERTQAATANKAQDEFFERLAVLINNGLNPP